MNTLYETDFFCWLNTQADLLKKKQFDKIDLEDLVEEIESLGRSHKRELKSYIRILFIHLLKKDYQPDKYTPSWNESILNAKDGIKDCLDFSPSLVSLIDELAQGAYAHARIHASEETGIDIKEFPHECPWDLNEFKNK